MRLSVHRVGNENEIGKYAINYEQAAILVRVFVRFFEQAHLVGLNELALDEFIDVSDIVVPLRTHFFLFE